SPRIGSGRSTMRLGALGRRGCTAGSPDPSRPRGLLGTPAPPGSPAAGGRAHARAELPHGTPGRGASGGGHRASVHAPGSALTMRSGYVLARATVPVMLKQGHGAIVNIASKAAVDHAAGAAAYAASKAGAVAMMDSLAAELKGTGVRVNSILPSIIDTEINRKVMPKADFAKWPKPEDIARVILFLCSDQAKLIHGAAMPVYGDT